MKQALLFGLCSTLFVASAFAGPQEIIKQKALNIRDQNNARQGVAPNQPAAPSSPAVTQPVVPPGAQSISQAQQQAIDKLSADLAAIKPGAEATKDQKQSLVTDMSVLAKGSTKPSQSSLSKLADDLAAALSDKNVTIKDPSTLSKNINILVNSGNLPATQVQTFIKAAQEALKATGAADQQVQALASNLKSITSELQKSKPKLYQ